MSSNINDLIESISAQLEAESQMSESDLPNAVSLKAPDAENVINALQTLLELMFPGRGLGEERFSGDYKDFAKRSLLAASKLFLPELQRAIPYRWQGESARGAKIAQVDVNIDADRILNEFLGALPEIRKQLSEDVQAAYVGDPAALSYKEVQLAYPGVIAIASHRLSHKLYKLDVPILPRIMSEWTHSQTGADIHPGATIESGFFIDHPTGVVIGETSKIGKRVKLYGGVTIGAKSFPLDENGRPIKHIQRHPTIEDEVVVYSNATILGGDTVIGKGSTIGGNVFLLESVPAGSFVVYQATVAKAAAKK